MNYTKLSYWKRSIQVIIAVSFTVLSVLEVILLGIILDSVYTRNAESQAVNDNLKVVDQVELNLANYLRNMMRISDSMYYSGIKDIDFAVDNVDQEMSLLYEANKDYLVSIACFDNQGKLVAATPVNTLKQNADITQQSWFTEARLKPENLHFSSSHVQNLFEYSNDRYHWVISLSKCIEITKNGISEGGILLVDMSFSGIEQLFAKVNTNDIGYTYLINQEGDIIYHPRQNLIYSNLLDENNIVAASYDDGVHEENFSGEERISIVKTVGYTGWKIVSVISKEQLYARWDQMNKIRLTIVLLAIIIVITINRLLSERITQPIRKLEDSVKELELHNPDSIYVGGSVEVQHLGMTIRKMVSQMKQLMDDVVREQEEKRKSEFDALQSQINPHFLYNALDSIVWMIEGEQYKDAVTMVTSLAKLFRISLSKGKSVISIKEEFQHASNYCYIQQIRFKNKFEAKFSLEAEIENCATIKLIIQPLIENAIYYGLESMDGDGILQVNGYRKQGDVYIDVIDNGIGMPPEQVEHLLTDGQYERKRGSGIGLRNVDQRIKLYFGDEYGLIIESEPDEGTKVSIHLPERLEVNENE